jgi:hypothetical protein
MQFGIFEGANKKYASFAALGWLGVLVVAAGMARQRLARWRWAESAVFAAMLALVLPLSIVGYYRETAIWQKMADTNWENAMAAFLHVNDGDRLHGIDGNEDELAEYLGEVERRGRGIFSYFTFRWGDDAGSVLARMRETPCQGSAQSLDQIPEANRTELFPDPGTPEVMFGWGWVNRDRAPPLTIIAVDSHNRIVGVARTTRTSALAEEVTGRKFYQDVGWFGLARLTEPPPLKIFGLSRDGRYYCSLGSLG